MDVLLSMAETVLPKLADAGTVGISAGQIEQHNSSSSAGTMPGGGGGEKPVSIVPENILQNPVSEAKHPMGKQHPMKMQLIFLCAQAKMNRDPGTYANMVLDNTPDEKLDELVDFMSGPNALEEMGKIHKGVLVHPKWFGALADEIMGELTDGEADPETESDSAALTGGKKPAINGEVITKLDIDPDVSTNNPSPENPDNSDTVRDPERESGH